MKRKDKNVRLWHRHNGCDE